MSKPFIIDHSDPKKVEICLSGLWFKVYPAIFYPDGSLHYFNEDYDYLRNKWNCCSVRYATKWRPIKEPKFRSFKDEEFEEVVKLLWGKCILHLGTNIINLIQYITPKRFEINGSCLNDLFIYYKYSDSPLSTDWKIIGKECEE